MDRRIAGGGTGVGEAGFAAVGILELDFFGRRGEVLAEEIAKGGAGGDVGVAVAVEGETVAVNVTAWPTVDGLRLEVSVVVVLVLLVEFTVWVTVFEVLPLSLVSPA